MASVADLPNEVLDKILLYLPPDHRLNCAVVCPRWQHLLSESRMLKDVRLDLAKAQIRTAMEVLQNTDRKYTSLKISDGELSDFNAPFWNCIGENLTELTLEKCKFSALGFVSILQTCRKLKSLTVYCCDASDSLLPFPEGISTQSIRESLRGVRHLSLDRSYFIGHARDGWITDASFRCLLELMPHLTSLGVIAYDLKFNDVRIEDISSVLFFPNVLACMVKCNHRFSSLDFSRTQINAEAIAQIVELYGDHLTELRLDGCYQLTDDAFVLIAKCRNLRLLSLSRTHIGYPQLKAILKETLNLEHLDLSHCDGGISNLTCFAISKLKRLQHLNLGSCCWISGRALASLERVRTLRHLNLDETACDVTVLRALSALPELRVLSVVDCDCCDDESLQLICNHLKKLEALSFGRTKFGMSTVTDVGASELHKLTGLRKLTLNKVRNITGRSLENGFGSVDMRSLSLSDAQRLTDSALVNIATHHRSLEDISLYGCTQITDDGVISLIQSATRLRTHALVRCPALTHRSLTVLQSHCPRLRRLELRGCKISKAAIDRFKRERPNVLAPHL